MPSSQSIFGDGGVRILKTVLCIFSVSFRYFFGIFSTVLGEKNGADFSNIHWFLVFNSGAVLPSLLALVHTNVLRSRFPGDPYLLASETAWCGREGEEGRKGERRGREEEGRGESFLLRTGSQIPDRTMRKAFGGYCVRPTTPKRGISALLQVPNQTFGGVLPPSATASPA